MDMREMQAAWVKPRKLTAHHFTYSTLSNVISYCDIDTIIKLFDTGSGFVFNANLLSIITNLEAFKQKLDS